MVDPAVQPPATPKLKMPPKAVSEAIVRRFLKPDQTIYWAREIPTWYKLYKQYPNVAFWQAFELPFKLNHMTWFDGVEGKVELERSYLLFNYSPPPLEAPTPVEPAPLDATPEPAYTPVARRPQTVAGMFKPLSSSNLS